LQFGASWSNAELYIEKLGDVEEFGAN